MADLPVDWLLDGESFVRYRTMVDLLGAAEDEEEVAETKNRICDHPLIRGIFEKQNRDGYWGSPRHIHAWWPPKDTTFWMLGVLGDFGFRKDDDRIAAACEYVFGTQLPSGAFGWGPPPTAGDCFTGILAESIAGLGYTDDPRLKRALSWLLHRQRSDGGFWCKKTGQPGGPREHEPSCAFATLCVLGALTRIPELRNGPAARRSADFLLECWRNRGKIKYAGHDSRIGSGWEKLKYPFTDYRILKYIDVLARIKLVGDDPAIAAIMKILVYKADREGRVHAESIHKAWSDFDFGQKKSPSRWLTFLVYHIVKRLIPPP